MAAAWRTLKIDPRMNSISRAFEALLDDYFNTFYLEHPADATHVGLSSGEGRFNLTTLSALRRQQARAAPP